jgi:hypothetical protein
MEGANGIGWQNMERAMEGNGRFWKVLEAPLLLWGTRPWNPKCNRSMVPCGWLSEYTETWGAVAKTATVAYVWKNMEALENNGLLLEYHWTTTGIPLDYYWKKWKCMV